MLGTMKVTERWLFLLTLARMRLNLSFLNNRVIQVDHGQRKADKLRELSGRFAESTLHFVDDNLSWLTGAIGSEELQDANLYLADWGYNSPDEQRTSRGTGRITVLTELEPATAVQHHFNFTAFPVHR